jgi:hypothetical protein
MGHSDSLMRKKKDNIKINFKDTGCKILHLITDIMDLD